MRENFRYTVTFFGVWGRRPDGFKATGGGHVRPQVAYSFSRAGLAVSLTHKACAMPIAKERCEADFICPLEEFPEHVLVQKDRDAQ